MQLNEANWIRVYSILSIVVWHCFSCPITRWGLLEPSFFTTIVWLFSSFFIPQANMPLFTCLSGYLFAYLFYSKKESYTTFTGIFKNKFHRLVIPFLVIGTIATAIVPERPLISGVIWGDGSSLWFCIMLFWLTMLRWMVLKINSLWISIILLLVSVIVYVTDVGVVHWFKGLPIGVLCMGRSFHFYLFFVLGNILYKYRDSFLLKREKKQLVIIVIAYIVVGTLQFCGIQYASFICERLMPIMLILVVFNTFTIVSELTITNHNLGGVISEFCRHSFGIYVLHEAISWNCYHSQPFLVIFRRYPFVYAFGFTVFTFLLCYVITHMCLKTKLGRYLLS